MRLTIITYGLNSAIVMFVLSIMTGDIPFMSASLATETKVKNYSIDAYIYLFDIQRSKAELFKIISLYKIKNLTNVVSFELKLRRPKKKS